MATAVPGHHEATAPTYPSWRQWTVSGAGLSSMSENQAVVADERWRVAIERHILRGCDDLGSLARVREAAPSPSGPLCIFCCLRRCFSNGS